jgi:hypothetical protein
MPADIHFDAAARREFLKIRRCTLDRPAKRSLLGLLPNWIAS